MFSKKIILILVILVSGCKQIDNAINEIFNSGTVTGLQRCIEINQTEIASSFMTRQSCIKSVDKDMPNELVEGSIKVNGTDPLEFYILVENISDDYYLTRGILTIQYRSSDGNSYNFNEDVFFETQPNERAARGAVFRELGEISENIKFCSQLVLINCITWSINSFGVTVR